MSTPKIKFDLQIKHGTEYGPEEERALLEVLRQGAPTSPIPFKLYPSPAPLPTDTERLIAVSQARFGTPRAEVEARIARFLGV